MSRLLTLFNAPAGAVVIAGNRNRVPNLVALSASANIMKYDGVSHVAPNAALTAVRAFFENRFAQANGPNSTTGLLSFKLQASVEYPIGGALYPLLFSGLDEITLNPGDGVWCDWTAVAIPAGAQYRIRTDREHLSTGGGNYNQLSGCLTSGNGTTTIGKIDHATSGTDNTVHKSRGGTYPALSGTASSYTATLVQGRAARRVKAALLLTDSIGRGTGDTKASAPLQQGDWLNGTSPTAPYVNYGNVGWPETSLGADYPYFSLGVAGKQVVSSSLNITNLGPQLALLSASPPGYCILALGVNDLMLGRTPAQVLADLITAVAMLQAAIPGLKVFVCTITPVTNTSDAYATTANQTFSGTPPAGNSVTWSNFNGTDETTGRRKLNADIRAGLVTGASGYIDVAAVVEDATDPRKWRVDLGQPTTDGVHPQAVLHRQMAAVPDYSVLFA